MGSGKITSFRRPFAASTSRQPRRSIAGANSIRPCSSSSSGRSGSFVLSSIAFSPYSLLWVVVVVSSIMAARGHTLVGGVTPVNSNDIVIQDLAKFAVDEYNKQLAEKNEAPVSLVGVVSAGTQVVSGTLYHLTLEVSTENGNRQFLAKIWLQPWTGTKQLTSFQAVTPVAQRITAADVGTRRDGAGPHGIYTLSVEDPIVEEAVKHAERSMRMRSNSLYPPEILEVVSAEAEIHNGANIYLVLKVLIANTEQVLRTRMHRDAHGKWSMATMEHVK